MEPALLVLPWWGYLLVALGLTHVTIAAVTIFLHRHQAHRAVDLHPVVSHFFRFWLWLTTGMVTIEWVAIHRKHHARCDQPEDPHSPQVYGIRRVLWSGAELYQEAAKDAEMLAKYGVGTPDDWLERHVYRRHPAAGIGGLLIAEVLLFGPLGLTIWAVQMLWIPFFAAGVINGIGHWWGYRSFATRDASHNIVPWGILIGGEELHNNHHAYAASARLSNRWWEFDVGWFYIRTLALLHLAQVKRLAPLLRFRRDKLQCDLETVQAILAHRYDVLTRYGRSLRRTVRAELAGLRARAVPELRETAVVAALKRWLQQDTAMLSPHEQHAVVRVVKSSPVLHTIYTMREELVAVWNRSAASKEQLATRLEDWCRRAEASGIAALGEFSRKLRSYATSDTVPGG